MSAERRVLFKVRRTLIGQSEIASWLVGRMSVITFL